MTPLYDIVLVAVMVVHSPFGPVQLEYQSVDYFNSWARCRQEQQCMTQKQNKRTAYICLKTDKE